VPDKGSRGTRSDCDLLTWQVGQWSYQIRPA